MAPVAGWRGKNGPIREVFERFYLVGIFLLDQTEVYQGIHPSNCPEFIGPLKLIPFGVKGSGPNCNLPNMLQRDIATIALTPIPNFDCGCGPSNGCGKDLEIFWIGSSHQIGYRTQGSIADRSRFRGIQIPREFFDLSRWL